MNPPMARPLVSIIVPSFNQGRFIAETLRSCLDQDYRPLEILVLDGGSTDETVSVLRSFDAPELYWWSEPDRGVVDAVNKGMVKAQGKYISIQSSDDTFLPGAVGAAVQALEDAPDAGLVYGDVEHIDAESRVTGADLQGTFDLAEYLGRLMYVPQPGTFFTREAMSAVGGWREEVSYAADADFWLRIATRFRVLKIDRLVARYRYHPDQRDAQRARIGQDWEQAVTALLASDVLDARQRRYARMGIHLARYHYAPDADWMARTCALYRGLIVNPRAVRDRRFPKRELLPGRDPIWRRLSLIKRALGFRPRAA